MIWNSNEVYSGEWEHGKQHGQVGRREASKGPDKAQGEHIWIMEGTNSINFQTFNRYVGQFEKGKRHGQGRFEYADGTIYEGGWNENHKVRRISLASLGLSFHSCVAIRMASASTCILMEERTRAV